MFASFNQTLTRAFVGTVGTAFCAGLCLVGATVPAKAGTLDAVRSQTVSYADLDLTSPAGRAVLDRRVRNAARAVCGGGSNDLAVRSAETRCMRDAFRAAQPKVVASVDAATAS